jgi:hypothetical protein
MHIYILFNLNIKHLYTNSSLTYLSIQSVPQREHYTSPLQSLTGLILFRELITVYTNMKPINILCGQNADLLNVKGDGFSTIWPLKLNTQNFRLEFKRTLSYFKLQIKMCN